MNVQAQPGAADRDRTGTVLPPRDFKSLASANSATAANNGNYYNTVLLQKQWFCVDRRYSNESRMNMVG